MNVKQPLIFGIYISNSSKYLCVDLHLVILFGIRMERLKEFASEVVYTQC